MMRFVVALVVLSLGVFSSGGVSAEERTPISNQQQQAEGQLASQGYALAVPHWYRAAPAPRPPFSAIGRINRRGGGFCSGTLVAYDRVLTTARCLWNRSLGQWYFAGDLHFLAGYHLGGHIEHRRVVSMEFSESLRVNSRGRPRRASNDWAILTLDRPIAASHKIQPVEMIKLRRRPRPGRIGPLVRAGFSPLKPHALTMSHCRAVAFFNRQALMHSCKAIYADSGHPIFVNTSDGWRILGLQMATYNRDAKSNGIGMALLVTAMSKRVQIRY
ncbi:MAG: trypsin-like serine protease [Alphaproteobacteria bacterium]|nr:trypsin-like serine protease [Alphaproteobacteria bacterium]